jgi:hypothetical protein
MRKINYFEIISDIPFGDEIDFLESEMKIAERDYFCKPQTFIKGLRQAINELKIEIISNAEKERERINNDIKNPGSWEFMYLYERGLSFADATDEQKQKSKEYNKQRSDKYIKERLADLEKVNSDTINQIAVLDSWQSKVNELERIIQKADNHEPQQQVDGKRYEVDNTLFKTIYKHCQGRGMFNIDEAEFLERIATADLSDEICNDGNKTKLRVLIKMIAKLGVINKSWYTDAVNKLGMSKSKLTKAQDYTFEIELETIIDEWRKVKTEYSNKVKTKLKSLNPT